MDCVIERIAEQLPPITEGERDFAHIMNKPEPERHPKYWYRHKETGAEYAWLEGGFAPPGYEYPGFAVIIAFDRVEHPDHDVRFIRVLEEFEAERQQDIEGLLKACVQLQKKYGCYPLLNTGFYTELDEASSDRVYNIVSNLYGDESQFWPQSTSQYTGRIIPFQQYLATLAHYKKNLDVHLCPKLQNYMLMVKKGKEFTRLKPEDIPAIAAIAYAVFALVGKKPWRVELPEESVYELEIE